jgi:cell wall-associated NlpC family hydrolase
MNEIDQRKAVVEEAKTWLKTPHVHMARLKGVGVDCALLLAEVYERTGLVEHIDPGYYPQDWHLHKGGQAEERIYLKTVLKYAHRVKDRDPLPGDIVLFDFGRCESHGAIVIEWPIVIHAYVGMGVIYGEADKNPLAGRLAGIFSIWG